MLRLRDPWRSLNGAVQSRHQKKLRLLSALLAKGSPHIEQLVQPAQDGHNFRMSSVRSITASAAKASLGDLIASLATDGPVEITRNGRKVAVLSAPPEQTITRQATRLAELAALYAAGTVAWREIAAETGAAFGDLLVELSRQNLQLPRVVPAKRPEQIAMFHAILRHAAQR